MKRFIVFLALLAPVCAHAVAADKAKPNILIILADDMGYGDAGFNGCKDIPTPTIDSIAKNGVRFSAGYVTAPQCAPSRSGLLTGRYQNWFGCEVNDDLENKGITRGIRLFGDYLHPAGYRTGIVGKWHLGTEPEGCHPLQRGFDFFYGFLGGGSFYFPRDNAKTIPSILDGRAPQQVTGFLTDAFGDQAIRFIESSKDKPFFLYLAFNAPHAPLQAPQSYLDRFRYLAVPGEPGVRCDYTKKHIDHPRQVYAAMIAAMDDNIARILACLRRLGAEDNTLIVFLSDNGGPTYVTAASNAPLRGVKGDTLEGGIRVPFAMQWKAVIPAGQTIDAPISSLDLLPTALAAAGAPVPPDANFDGMNILPLVTGQEKPGPRTLTWRFPFPPKQPKLHVWAVRQGDWKLVKEVVRDDKTHKMAMDTKVGLYQLSRDITESNDLSAEHPRKRQALQSTYDDWNSKLPAPFTTGNTPAPK